MTSLLRKNRIKPERAVQTDDRKKIDAYVEQSVPDKHKLATQRALLGQITRSTAIRVKCLQCCGYQRDEIKVCSVITCALFPVRPYQDKNAAVEEADGGDEE